MRHWIQLRLAELRRRLRRFLATWRLRDPKPWVLALVGMTLGLGLFVLQVALVEIFRFIVCIAKSLR